MMPSQSRASRIKQIKVLTQKKREIFIKLKKRFISKIDPFKLKRDEQRNLMLMKENLSFSSLFHIDLMLKNQNYPLNAKENGGKQKKK